MDIINFARDSQLDNLKTALDSGDDVNQIDESGWTALMHASSKGHADCLRLLLNNAASINISNGQDTALTIAASYGQADCVRILIDEGANVNWKTVSGGSVIHYAAGSGNASCLNLLLNEGVDVNAVDAETSWTPLMIATMEGHLQCAQLLINSGSKLAVQDNAGHSALMFAAITNKTELVRLLAESKTDINLKSNLGQSALHLASARGYVESVKILIDCNADISSKDTKGWDALMHATSGNFPNVLEVLVAANANINSVNNLGSTSLIAATALDHVLAFNALIKLGIDVNIQNQNGATALYFAVASGKTELANTLLRSGANTEAVTNDGYTALINAAMNGHLDCVIALCNAGANINTTTPDGKSALYWSIMENHISCAEYLVSQNAKFSIPEEGKESELMRLCKIGNINLIRHYLNQLKRLDAKDEQGFTALMYAAGNGHVECAQLLLEKGADLNAVSKQNSNAVYVSALMGHANCLTLLLSKGANPHLKTTNKFTPLWVAASNGDLECVEILYSYFCRVSTRNYIGETPLMAAAQNGHYDCVKFLLETGSAEINAESDNKENALLLALRGKHLKVAQLLTERRANCNIENVKKVTPLSLAKELGFTQLIVDWVKKGRINPHTNLYKLFNFEISRDRKLVLTIPVSAEQQQKLLDDLLLTSISQNDIATAFMAIDGGANPLSCCFADYVSPLGLAIHNKNEALVELIEEQLSATYSSEKIEAIKARAIDGIKNYYKVMAVAVAKSCTSDKAAAIILAKNLAERFEKGGVVNVELRRLLYTKTKNDEVKSPSDNFDFQLKLDSKVVELIKEKGFCLDFPEIDRSLVSETELNQIIQELIIMTLLQQQPRVDMSRDPVNEVRIDITLTESLCDTLVGQVLIETDRFMKDYVHNSVYVPREERFKRNETWREILKLNEKDQPQSAEGTIASMREVISQYKDWGGVDLGEIPGVHPLAAHSLSHLYEKRQGIVNMLSSGYCLFNQEAVVTYDGNTLTTRDKVRVVTHGTALYQDGQVREYKNLDSHDASHLTTSLPNIPVSKKEFALLNAIYAVMPAVQIMVMTGNIIDFRNFSKMQMYSTEQYQLPVIVRWPDRKDNEVLRLPEMEQKLADSIAQGKAADIHFQLYGGVGYNNGFSIITMMPHPTELQVRAKYNKDDGWRLIKLNAGTRVVGNWDSDFFSSESTLKKSQGSDKKFYDLVQVKPGDPDKYPHPYRQSVSIFELIEDITCWANLTRNNVQHSNKGGVIQLVIYDFADTLREIPNSKVNFR